MKKGEGKVMKGMGELRASGMILKENKSRKRGKEVLKCE